MKNMKTTGSFTLPGEAGYEKLSLEMAEKWGADVIRDSDGTKLSDELLNSGLGIYSTICIIRDHNEWARANQDKLQQTFLPTAPKIARENTITIHLLEDFFEEQFRVNDSKDAMKYWQVFDRTTGEEVSRYFWNYEKEAGNVIIQNAKKYHAYSVDFLAYRIWEEISMYNHTTNHWNREHLMQIDPRYPETQEYLCQWMEEWCQSHPHSTVVRFTSMFYNFTWIWCSDERNRSLYSDWASYDYTVSPMMLDLFADQYGYGLAAEDFVNQGKLHVTHMPADQKKLDYMSFVNKFVVDFGKKLVEIVHRYGKKAYVFYDDSWVGVEPYQDRFREFGFDGLIKCVFSGYEARLCAGVPVETHELRLHPYLFPVGLGGAPTFMEGGNPVLEAQKFWNSVRRAILREPIERIGLGGYLHLVENYPDFCDYMAKVADEFRMIRQFHEAGKPAVLPCRVAVLHSWGKLRSWSLSGHFHETFMHELIHINEALSGLPVEVSFLSFEDVKKGVLDSCQIVINAGRAGSAWSGGDAWKDPIVYEKLTEWVDRGGCFIGVGEPSAVSGFDTSFRMAQVLGVDLDNGERVCHGRWKFEVEQIPGLHLEAAGLTQTSWSSIGLQKKPDLYLIDGKTKVLAELEGIPTCTLREFGKGKGIYLSSFAVSPISTRLLLQLLMYGAGIQTTQSGITDHYQTECAYFPDSKALVVINNSADRQTTSIMLDGRKYTTELEAYDTRIINL